MSDGEALFRAILDAPDDDAPRLVYADWLDEHGEPERAEFIRVQCEIARRTELDGRALGILDELPEVKELRRREWDCSIYLKGSWVPACLSLTLNHNWIWHRGFVHSVTCTAADWLAHADAITAAHPVREVRLTTWPDADTSIIERQRKWKLGPFPGLGLLDCWRAEWPGITFHLPEPVDPRRTATPRLMYR